MDEMEPYAILMIIFSGALMLLCHTDDYFFRSTDAVRRMPVHIRGSSHDCPQLCGKNEK